MLKFKIFLYTFLIFLIIFTGKEIIFLENSKLLISFLDINKGSAIYIKTPINQKILIQGGGGSDVLEALSKELSFFEKTLDAIILLSLDNNEINGVLHVLGKYNVKKLYITTSKNQSETFQMLLKIIKQKQIPLEILNLNQDVFLQQDLFFDFIQSQCVSKKSECLANNTALLRIIYNNKAVALLNTNTFIKNKLKILTTNLDLHAKIYQIAKSGDRKNIYTDFIKSIVPQLVVIIIPKKSQYPHLETLEKLKNFDILMTQNKKNINFWF